MQAGTQATQVT